MKMKSKRFAIALFSILLAILYLGMNSALADGSSNERASVTPFNGQVRAGVTPDYTITLSNSMATDSSKEYDVTGNVIELKGLNKTYEITGATTTYGIKADEDCIILLNGVDIQLSSGTPIDVQNKTVSITLQGSSINEIKTTASNRAGVCTTGGTLTINGAGKLKAQGAIMEQESAEATEEPENTVTISGSAVVTATGGTMGAGIGSGRCDDNTNGGTIKITGGMVKATGGAIATGGESDRSGGAGLGTGGINSRNSSNINAETIEIAGGTVIAQGGDNAPDIGLSAGGDSTYSVGNGFISGGNVLSIDGTGALATQEMELYTDASPGNRQVYQNTLTVDQLTTTGVISSITTSHGASYTIAGANTISYGGAEVVSVWLIETTISESVEAEINGDIYSANYIRQVGLNTQTLYYLTTPVTGITLDKSVVTLLPNLSEGITATVLPANATDKSVIWSSSDTNIATVDNVGVVTGKNVGTATITATTVDGNCTATCTVTVNPATYTVTPSTLTFTGGTGDLTFKVE